MSGWSEWRKSSYSQNLACVEVRRTGGIDVRDSKAPDGPQLQFSPEDWAAFTAGLKSKDDEQ